MKYKISQVAPYVDDRELENLKSVIKNKWITEGPFSEKLLEMIKDYTHAKYAVLVNNGTLGLYLSLKAIGVDNNDEVIVPNFTFMASASSVIFAGGKPVLIDVFENDNLLFRAKTRNPEDETFWIPASGSLLRETSYGPPNRQVPHGLGLLAHYFPGTRAH